MCKRWHVPLVDETRHMMNAETFGMMKPTAYLVNTSRGPVVDLAALEDALQSGRIVGAAIDVYDEEPPKCVDLLALRRRDAQQELRLVGHELAAGARLELQERLEVGLGVVARPYGDQRHVFGLPASDRGHH